MSKPKKTTLELEALTKNEAAKTMLLLPKNLAVSIWSDADRHMTRKMPAIQAACLPPDRQQHFDVGAGRNEASEPRRARHTPLQGRHNDPDIVGNGTNSPDREVARVVVICCDFR